LGREKTAEYNEQLLKLIRQQLGENELCHPERVLSSRAQAKDLLGRDSSQAHMTKNKGMAKEE
jgi:hypothetical protein